MSAYPVTLTGVSKRFAKQLAVDHVDLQLRAGESVALAGHNGAGKSTLLKLILGLIHPSEGQVHLMGHETSAAAAVAVRKEIGYLPETVSLYPSLTGIEVLNFFAKLKGQPLAKNQELLSRVGLLGASTRRVRTYSKGMRQRLALAQAMLGDPQVLLFDEPTTGLDPASRQVFYEIVSELRAKGATILLSSHALSEIEAQTDRIVVMKQGKKIADGTLSELRVQSELPTRVVLSFESEAAAQALLAQGTQTAEVQRVGTQTAEPSLAVDQGTVGQGYSQEWRRLDAHRVESYCDEAGKVAKIQSLAQFQGVNGIDIQSPSLDDIYAHFLRREDDI